VRHCVPPLSLSFALATSISCLHLTHKCLSPSRRVDLSISQPSEARQDTRTSRQEAKDCSIDSRSRCVPLSLMLALTLSQSLSLWRSID